MNKWQIICPLAALAVAGLVFGLVFVMIGGSRDYKAYLFAQTRMIGQELIASTNLQRLDRLDSKLAERLSRFLSCASGVAEVKLGDEPAPIGDGTAASRLILLNAAGERLGIRLRQESKPETFHVLSFWTVPGPGGATN